MSFFNRLIAVLVCAALAGPLAPLQAKTRKGDKYLAEGRIHEVKKEWDAALESYEQALSEDPAEIEYQIAVDKARFEASQAHVENGIKIRAQGKLGEALLEFQKAYAISPGSVVAGQELQVTQEMIARERKRVEDTGKEAPAEVRALTPTEQVKKEEMEKIDRILPVPELKPLNSTPLTLRMAGQKTKVVFETIARLAGINVVWDPDYQAPAKDTINVDLNNSTLEDALDYVSVETKSFWKALSPNTIFITNDNQNKRRDYEEQVTKVFYLQNISQPAELQEIVNVVRTACDINRVFPYNAQFALVVRGEADRVELAEKLIHDLDKPKSEVLVDILIMEASSTFSKQVTAAIASTGLNLPISFNPRSSIQVQNNSTSSSTSTASTTSTTSTTGTTTTTPTTGTTAASSATTGTLIPLSSLGHLSSADFATTLPGALLQAALSDAKTKVLQAPQLRAVDNLKATMNIGEREPTASGSFQPGVGGVGINPLVNTQFTYLDVGVNVALVARVHDNNEVSMHITLDISSVTGTVNLGGIPEPIIGQKKIEQDLRMREGEIGLLGGLIQQQDDRTVTGIPGLSSIPLLGRLFSGNSVDHNRDDLMIVLVPHILRRPEITPENIRAIAVGNTTTIQLHYAPKPQVVGAADLVPVGAGATGMPSAAASATPPATAASAAPPAAAPSAGLPPATAPPLPPATAPPLPPAIAPPPTGGAAPAAAATPASAAPAAAATVRFSPNPVSTIVDGTLKLSVVIDGGTDVFSAPMQVAFNPKILKLNDVALGDFLSSDGQRPVFAKNIMNDAGQASIALTRTPGVPGVSGPSGTLVTLTFQAVGTGNTAVTLPNMVVRNSQGQPIASGSPQATVTVK
jgi:general secretion pathway protein D